MNIPAESGLGFKRVLLKYRLAPSHPDTAFLLALEQIAGAKFCKHNDLAQYLENGHYHM